MAPAPRRPRRPRRRRAVAGALSAVLLVGGCSSEPSEDGASPAVSEAEPDLASKPDLSGILTDDRGDPPTTLQVTDLVEGGGTPATVGDSVTVDYVGVTWATGTQFDATWDRGQAYTFTLGRGEVIAGWDQGVEGMRVGGRRVLIVPPDLAYGDRGAGTDIGPGETLAFVIDLLEVE